MTIYICHMTSPDDHAAPPSHSFSVNECAATLTPTVVCLLGRSLRWFLVGGGEPWSPRRSPRRSTDEVLSGTRLASMWSTGRERRRIRSAGPGVLRARCGSETNKHRSKLEGTMYLQSLETGLENRMKRVLTHVNPVLFLSQIEKTGRLLQHTEPLG